MNQWMAKVDSRDISVVIQGPLYRTLAQSRGSTPASRPSGRTCPTWKLSSPPGPTRIWGIDADVVVTAVDPGVLVDFNGNRHNTNRQIVSTLTGIRVSSRKHVLKLRSDIILTGSQIAVLGAYDSGAGGRPIAASAHNRHHAFYP